MQRGSSFARTEIDISDVLAETEAALLLAQDALPSSDRISADRHDLNTFVAQQQKQDQQRQQPALDDSMATIIAGTVAEVGNRLSQQVDQASQYAKQQLEENGNDITKLPGTILNEMGTKADENLRDMRKSQSQFADDFKNGQVFKDLVTFLKSDEVKKASSELLHQTEQTSVKTLQLIKAGVESYEVKRAQQKTIQALQDGIESEEVKTLQNKASTAIQGQLQSLKKL